MPYLAMRILVQFVAQAIGVILLRKKFGSNKLPFKMWWYPLPVIISYIHLALCIAINRILPYGDSNSRNRYNCLFYKRENLAII